MRRLALVLALLVGWLAVAVAPADAQRGPRPLASGMISAEEAHQKAQSGELVLVDIRTPEEWKETGVGAGARPITMHQRPQRFLELLAEATGGDKSKRIALICATGGRSADLRPALARFGYQNVVDVAEGMEGSAYGPGWKKRGLPTVSGAVAGQK